MTREEAESLGANFLRQQIQEIQRAAEAERGAMDRILFRDPLLRNPNADRLRPQRNV
jgi:hypothetical protein